MAAARAKAAGDGGAAVRLAVPWGPQLVLALAEALFITSTVVEVSE